MTQKKKSSKVEAAELSGLLHQIDNSVRYTNSNEKQKPSHVAKNSSSL